MLPWDEVRATIASTPDVKLYGVATILATHKCKLPTRLFTDFHMFYVDTLVRLPWFPYVVMPKLKYNLAAGIYERIDYELN